MAKKSEVITSDKIKFIARAAFVRLDKPRPFEEGAEPRYETTFLLDPSSEAGKKDLKTLLSAAAKIAKEKWGVVPKELKRVASEIGIPGITYDPKAKDDGIKFERLYNGDTKEYDGFAGMWVLATHNTEKPAVVDRKGNVVHPGEDQFPFSGCYVRGSITWWTQDNKYGKAIGVNLRGVQWVKTGEAFSGASIDPEGEFDALDDEVDDSGADDAPFAD